MLALRHERFPFEAVRDLLGIVRALYAAEKLQGAGERRLAHIRRVGLELRAAADLAFEYEPLTLGHAAAWQRAERATLELGELIDCTTPLEPTLRAAVHRVRPSGTPPARRDAARRARR
jgi:hypothetical protein